MGRCVDMIKVDIEPFKDCIIKKLKVENTKENRDLIQRVLDKFGYTHEGAYIILNNEFTEDWNPYFNICTVLASAFGQSESKIDLFDCFYDKKVKHDYLKSYADKYEVADELGIELIEDGEED